MENDWTSDYNGGYTKELRLDNTYVGRLKLHVLYRDSFSGLPYYYKISFGGYWMSKSSAPYKSKKAACAAAEMTGARLVRIIKEVGA